MRHPMRLPGGDRPTVWFKAGAGVQGMLVGSAPERFGVPPYIGHRGWVAAYLDGDADWDEIVSRHRGIADAIERHDGSSAVSDIEHHLSNVLDDIEQLKGLFPDYFA